MVRTVRLASSLQDTNTQRQSINAELHRRAFFEPLTDLPNRLLFEDCLQQALAKTKRGAKNPRRVAVLCVDLDGFKKKVGFSPSAFAEDLPDELQNPRPKAQ